MLKHLVKTVQNIIRVEDILGRWGGEEFLILANINYLKQATALAERIRAAVETSSLVVDGTYIHYTVSIGIAAYSIHGKKAEALIKAADRALYQAKNSGRNQVVIAG